MYPARGTLASTLPPSAYAPDMSIDTLKEEKRTHGDGLADVSLDLLGDVFLDEELDGHAIAVLKYRLHAESSAYTAEKAGKSDGPWRQQRRQVTLGGG